MVSQVGTVQVTAASSNTAQLTIPSGVQDGDTVLLAFSLESATAPVPPVGQGYRQLPIESTGTPLSLHFFYTVVSASDASTFHTFTCPSVWRQVYGVVLRDEDRTRPLVIETPAAATDGTDTSVETPSEASSGEAGAWVLWFATSWADTTKTFPATADGNTVTRLFGGSLGNISLGVAEYSSVSAVSSITVGLSAAPTSWMAKTVIARPASGDQAPYLHGAGAAVFTATNGANLTPPLPVGWAAEDIHVLIAHRSDNTAMTALSGWTQLSAANNTTAQRVEIWARRAVAGDTAPTSTNGTGTVVRGAQIIGIRGVDPSLPLTSIDLSRSNNAASLTVTWATLTPSNNNSLLLALYAYEDDPASAAQQVGWSNFSVSTSALGNDMALGYAVRPWVSGATGALTALTGGPSSPNVGVLLAFKPVSSGPTPITGTGGVAIGLGGFGGSGTYDAPPVTGTGGVSIARPALSSVGLLAYSGAGGISVGRPALTGVGALVYAGTGGLAIGKPALAGVGVLAYVASGGLVVGRPVLGGVGLLAYPGVGGVTLSRPVLSGTGVAQGPPTGVGALSIGAPVLTGSGVLAYMGEGGVLVGGPVFGGVGVLTYSGLGGLAIGAPGFAGVGLLAYAGSGGLLVGGPQFAGIGELSTGGAAGVTIDAPQLSGTGLLVYAGVGSLVVGAPVLGGSGFLSYAGIGSVSVGVPAVGGSGYLSYSGLGAMVVSGPMLAGSGAYIPSFGGAGALVIGAPQFAGVGRLEYAANGAISIGIPAFSGMGLLEYSAVGGVMVSAPSLAGVGEWIPVGEGYGGINISRAMFGGSGFLSYAGIAGVSIGVPSFVGSGVLSYSGMGSVLLGAPQFAGVGQFIEDIDGLGGIVLGVGQFGGVGTFGLSGAGGMLVGVPSFMGSGALAYVGEGGVIVSVPAFGGSGTLVYVGSGALVIGVGEFGGSGTALAPPIGGLGSVVIGVPVFGGAGVVIGLMPPIVGVPYVVMGRASRAVKNTNNSSVLYVGRSAAGAVFHDTRAEWEKQ